MILYFILSRGFGFFAKFTGTIEQANAKCQEIGDTVIFSTCTSAEDQDNEFSKYCD